jgi:ATP-dependent protease HslVU (ClpYQ) peptidase subunit
VRASAAAAVSWRQSAVKKINKTAGNINEMAENKAESWRQRNDEMASEEIMKIIMKAKIINGISQRNGVWRLSLALAMAWRRWHQ